jgi:hypothetical protein
MGEIIDGVRIEAESPPGSQRAGAAVTVKLHFTNAGDQERTLFFIESEAFRFGQSTFRMQARGRPTVVQPMSRGGYVPRESDFHSLPPHGRLLFTQQLLVPRTTPSGSLAVEWVYQNLIDRWPSELFNGGESIPGIWKGRSTLELKVTVSRS